MLASRVLRTRSASVCTARSRWRRQLQARQGHRRSPGHGLGQRPVGRANAGTRSRPSDSAPPVGSRPRPPPGRGQPAGAARLAWRGAARPPAAGRQLVPVSTAQALRELAERLRAVGGGGGLVGRGAGARGQAADDGAHDQRDAEGQKYCGSGGTMDQRVYKQISRRPAGPRAPRPAPSGCPRAASRPRPPGRPGQVHRVQRAQQFADGGTAAARPACAAGRASAGHAASTT